MARTKGARSVASVITGKRQKLATPESAWEKLWMAKMSHLRIRGKGVLDMPGVDYDHKKLNWFLWRRGLIDDDMPHAWSKYGFARQRKKTSTQPESENENEI